MEIRIANENDLPQILELYSHVDTGEDESLNIDDARKIYDRMKSYPDYEIFAAERDGKIAGTFALAIMDNLAHGGKKSGLIEDVVVSHTLRGQGIGTKMMKFAIELCKEKSCYKVCLSSNIKRENTHRFYQKLGFKIHGYSFLIELE